jgi:hypothetical protein
MIFQDVNRIKNFTGQLLHAVRQALTKIVASFFSSVAIGAGAVEGLSFTQGGPSGFTHIAAATFGIALGYAVGLTVAVVEALRGIVEAGKEAIKDVGQEITQVEHGASNIVKNVEKGLETLEHIKH